MAAITLAQYKALTGITSTSRDTQISALITDMVADFTAYCNVAPPTGSNIVQAQMISFLLATISGPLYKSESIEGWDYTREEVGKSGYPTSVEGALEKFRIISPKYTQPLTQFRDRREITLEALASGNPVYSTEGEPIEEEAQA